MGLSTNTKDSGVFLNIKKLVPYITLGVFSLFLVLSFIVYRSFLVSLFTAAIMYIIFRNAHSFILSKLKDKPGLSAAIASVLVIVVIVIPLFTATLVLIKEISIVVEIVRNYIKPENLNLLYEQNRWLTDWLGISLNDITSLQSKLLPVIQETIPKILAQSGSILNNIMKLIFNFILSIVVLFFLFRNADSISDAIYQNLPYPSEIKQKIGARVIAVFDAVVKGNLLIAVAQGVIIGLLFWIFGLSTPILYGTLGAFFGLIPLVGTNILWIPGGLYLYYQGMPIQAVTFSMLSFAAYLLLENIAKPLLLDKELHLHPMLLFLSILGGLSEFGIKGLIIGPFAITICISIWQMIKIWNLKNETI